MTDAVQSLEDIRQALSAPENRVVYTYKLPASLTKLTGISSIGIVELTPSEIILAKARGGEDQFAVGLETIKEAWRRVDGRRLSTADGSVDVEWGKNAPGWSKLRTLLGLAYNELHNPKKEDADDFLASQMATTG
jgi:hypothetical protein